MYDNKSSDGFYLRHPWPPHGTQWNPAVLNPGFPEQYAAAIAGKGAALDNCFGFVDGTVRPISKPGEQQRIV